jgi:hypothetical protein
MGLFECLFGRDTEKEELARWIVEHNTYEYLGTIPWRVYSFDKRVVASPHPKGCG